ncbi:MAG: hypothetical protein J7527_19765, partial [Chitinophagaceae bacterium]|nr:hypothetical protein [Chitinophagaceae bacterium]
EDVNVKGINSLMMVDSGAYMMCINEVIQSVLQLPFIERRSHFLANDTAVEHDIVGPVMVKFDNRTAICSAAVLEGDAQPLLGAIPMEEMDVLIHPLRQELIINPKHPHGAMHRL